MSEAGGGSRTGAMAAAGKTTWTVGDLLTWTAKFLAQKGSEFPRLDTEVLLAHTLACRPIELYTRFAEPATDEQRDRFRELVRQRVEGCPVAYLVGRKEFFLLELEVSPAVLIPRPDSEVVVVEFLQLTKLMAVPSVVDIGTGSGNLAVSIAKQHKGARVAAVDISPDALAVARRNAAKHGVAERVRFVQGDLFTPLGDERFDVVVSNPPYIPTGDIAGLAPGVRNYEPHLALDGGVDGFAVFDRLIEGAERHLNPGGHLLVEIGSPQEGPARERLGTHAGFELAETLHDGGGLPRVLKAQRKR